MTKMKQKSSKQSEDFARIDRELTDIYRNSDGSMPNMKNFEKKKRGRFVSAFVFLLFSCAVLALVAWAGFFFFEPKSGFREQDVILAVTGDESVTPGGKIQFRVRYRNDQPVMLNNANLEIRYPAGFIFEGSSVSSTDERHDTWALGAIAAGEGGYVDIFGRYYGSVGEKQSVRAFLNYEPANFSSQFQKVANLNLIGDRIGVNLRIVAPAQAAVGSEVDLSVAVEKAPDFVEKIENLKLVMDQSSQFQIKSAKPVADKNSQNVWTVGDLSTTTRINLRGSFGGNENEMGVVKFSLIGRYGDGMTGEYVLSENSVTTTLAKTAISLSMAANGSMGSLALAPASDFNVGIVLNNAGSADISNARIRFILDAPSAKGKSIMAWSKIDDARDGTIDGEQLSETVRRGMVTWTSSEEKKLAKIKPGERVEINFNLPVKSPTDIDLGAFTTASGTAMVEVQFDEAGENKIISGNEIEIKYNSDLKFSTRDEVSSDGLVHDISWVLENSFHDLENLKLEADLYGDFEFDESALVVPAGEVKYDKEKKKLVWNIPQLPVAIDTAALQFRIKLTKINPTQTNLTSKVKIFAKDSRSGGEIMLAGDEVLLRVGNGE